ncbi:MAG: copper-binding protein, partial [Limisphaerales bacterium]
AHAGDQTFHSYSARGVVEKIAPDLRQVTIHHQAIPGYMMEMTMDFPVQNTNELNGISPGDKITFTLVVGKTNDWVENIHRVGHTDKTMSNSMNMSSDKFSKLKPGDLLPDGELLTENGRHIHLSDFRGKAVAFTFFFTRCPLPNYCPLMNRNFAAARDLILSMSNAPTNWELLSISFDPGFDTPETLANYARSYRGENTNHWIFAAATTNTLAKLAPRVGLMVMRQGNNISHNLRTIVLDPEGRISRQFNGNNWTAQELADALLEAARRQTNSAP